MSEFDLRRETYNNDSYDVFFFRTEVELKNLKSFRVRSVRSIGLIECSFLFDIIVLSRFIESCVMLDELVLDECLLGDQDLETIIGRLPKSVRKLSLYSNMFGTQGLVCLNNYLPSTVEHLNLGGNSVSNDGVLKISEMMNGRFSFSSIVLARMRGTFESFIPIIRELVRNRSIKHLDLSSNVLSDEEFRMLMTRQEVPFHCLKLSKVYNLSPRYLREVLSKQGRGIKEIHLDGLVLSGEWSTRLLTDLKVLSIMDADIDMAFASYIRSSRIDELSLTDSVKLLDVIPSSLRRLIIRGMQSTNLAEVLENVLKQYRLNFIDLRDSSIQKYQLLKNWYRFGNNVLIRSNYEDDDEFRILSLMNR